MYKVIELADKSYEELIDGESVYYSCYEDLPIYAQIYLNNKVVAQLEQSWLNKSDYESELMIDLYSDEPHMTWDEFYEINDRHVEFEECLDKLNIKPYINSFKVPVL